MIALRVNLQTPDSDMNRTEARFWREQVWPAVTAGEVQWWAFEGLKFRLGKNLLYIPDFDILQSDGALWCVDTKGTWGGTRKHPEQYAGWKEDARVKIRAAADQYPWVRFFGAHKTKGRSPTWIYEKFEPAKLPPRVSPTP